MISRYFILLFSLCSFFTGTAQTWLPMDKGIDCFYVNGLVKQIVVDTVADKLYISGSFHQDDHCTPMRGVAQWNGGAWNSMGYGAEGNYAKFGMTMYNDTLYLSGNFYDVNTNFYLGKWNGTYWDTIIKIPEVINTYAQKDGILYLGGTFDYMVGDSTYIIKKYDGTRFTGDIPYCFTGSGNAINAMAFYHDTLYVGGYYDLFSCYGLSNLGKWDGTSLQLLSPEFANIGANSNILTMAVFQDELYVGGYFMQSHGYAGNYIMKWNGHAFSPVGSGMNNLVRCMKVYNDKLYVGGDFTDAGGVASNYVAMWDGGRWNSMTTDTFNIPGGALLSVYAMDVYHDSLIIGGSFTSINGDTACRKIAKYNAALTGIDERKQNNSISVFPNPASDQITITFTSSSNTILEIKNTLAQTMYVEQVKGIPGKQSKTINISAFSKGVYFVRLQNERESVATKFIKP